MALRTIRLVPDPVLRETCAAVTRFDVDLQVLTDDMLETMYAAPGRGLAAPQIGVTQRVFVMDATWKDGTPAPQVFVNPQITAASEDQVAQEEGCLSIPDRFVEVARPAAVTMTWQGLDGAAKSAEFTGFSAACVQHELDHLNGVLCTDYAGET